MNGVCVDKQLTFQQQCLEKWHEEILYHSFNVKIKIGEVKLYLKEIATQMVLIRLGGMGDF